MTKDKIFTKDEIVALKELAEEHIRSNEITHGEKTNIEPNVFPKGYTGPRSYAEAMSRKWIWNSVKQEWSKRK